MNEAGTVIVSLLSSNIFSLRPIIFKEDKNENNKYLLHVNSICQIVHYKDPVVSIVHDRVLNRK